MNSEHILRRVASIYIAQVAGYCEKVAAIQDKRSVLYHSFEEALLKLKANKDISAFQSAARKIAGKGT